MSAFDNPSSPPKKDASHTQPHNLPLSLTPQQCAGSTYIVTGANTGLGLAAAHHLVSLGSKKVVMACRNTTAGLAALQSIESVTGKKGIAEVWALDLSSYSSIREFAKRCEKELEGIDVLIENAALGVNERILAEGHLLPTTVNVFGTFLLMGLLLPVLVETGKKGRKPHVAVVTSGACFDMEDSWKQIEADPVGIMDGEGWPGVMRSYPLSKLLEIWFVRELVKHLPVEQTGVVINLVNPGLCITDLARNAPQEFKDYIAKMHAEWGRTAEDGSKTLLFGANGGEKSHGRYTDDCEIHDERLPSWIGGDEAAGAQKRVFDIIIAELESVEPGCFKNFLKA